MKKEENISEADSNKIQKRKNIKTVINGTVIVCIAAVILIIDAIVYSIYLAGAEAEKKSSTGWPVKEVYADKKNPENTGLQDKEELPGETVSVSMQFPCVTYNGIEYSSRDIEVEEANVGKFVDSMSLESKSTDNDTYHEIDASMYSIKGISVECAAALKFEETDVYYVYINPLYNPETLGEFMDDLNLQENLLFGSVQYYYYYGNGERSVIEFADVKADTIWSQLFTERDVRNIYNEGKDYSVDMVLSADMPIFGYENISIILTSSGYVVTNILGTEKAFYVGVVEAQTFIVHVVENCQGYEISYVKSEQ